MKKVMKMVEERLLRFEAPALYKRMVETLSAYNIHPYDIQATAWKHEDELEVSVRFFAQYSQVLSTRFPLDKALHPDEAVTSFFEDAADKCKSTLITDDDKMIKP